jgi:hypothetical protein
MRDILRKPSHRGLGQIAAKTSVATFVPNVSGDSPLRPSACILSGGQMRETCRTKDAFFRCSAMGQD